MATLMLDDCISEGELSKHREKYSLIKVPTEDDRFQFALTLTRSKNKSDVREGLGIFQSLFAKTKDENVKRDSLYYMAIAATKLSNYEEALKYLQTILNVQPNNDQVRDLHEEVTRRMKRDGLIGIGIVGSAAAVGVIGLIGLGAAMIAKRN